jgi:hypothetical protein
MNILSIFIDGAPVAFDGDDALTFLAVAMVLIMFFSLIITHFITNTKKASKGKTWISSSSNKPNINKF